MCTVAFVVPKQRRVYCDCCGKGRNKNVVCTVAVAVVHTPLGTHVRPFVGPDVCPFVVH